MMEKSAEAVACWLIKCGAIKDEDKELYSYAAYSFILFLSPLFLAVVFGLCLGCVKRSIVIIIPFMAIRKYSGGYHTKHLWTCLLCSSLLLLLCILFSFVVLFDWKLLAAMMMAGISLIICSPLDNENRILSPDEKIRYKKIAAILVVLFLLLSMSFYFMELHIYADCISTGIILSAGLQMPNVLKRQFKP